MRKMMFILSAFLILGGCAESEGKTSSDMNKEFIFDYAYSTNLFHFGKIVKALSEAEDKQDLQYISGLMDSYINYSSSHKTIQQMSEMKKFEDVVHPLIQPNLLKCIGDAKPYIEDVRDIVKEGDLAQIKERKEEFSTLYDLERSLNDDRFQGDKHINIYNEHLENMIDLLN